MPMKRQIIFKSKSHDILQDDGAELFDGRVLQARANIIWRLAI